MKKKISIAIVIILLIFLNFNTVYGAEILKTGKEWLELGKNNAENGNVTFDWTSFNELAGIFWGIGIFVILIIGITIGIRYMFSSVEGKAQLKQTLMPFLIGAVIILVALGIWRFLVVFLDGLA